MLPLAGATTEFSKWEGIALDTKRSVLYAALTAVDVGMLKGEAPWRAPPFAPKGSSGARPLTPSRSVCARRACAVARRDGPRDGGRHPAA